jgi:subtilisin family serine protease
MVCKVVNHELKGYYSQWISGIYYAVDHGAQVINFSLAGEEPSKALEEAVDYAERHGVLIIASMYNLNSSDPCYPAAYEPVIAVGATDPDDKRSTAFNGNPQYGSNYGAHLDVVAPGNYIVGLNRSFSGSGTVWAGTSMASPVVAGIASLLWAQYPSRDAEDIRMLIYASAEDLTGTSEEDTPGWDPYYGYGRVNAFLALSGDTIRINNQLKVFPNPAVTQLYIDYKLKQPGSSFLYILNMNGQIIKKIQNLQHNEKIPLNVSALPAGMYLVVLNSGSNRLTQKFVVIHK